MPHKSFQFQMRQHRYLYTLRIGFSLLCLFFFILFCCLGDWQIHRYQYKKILLSTYENGKSSEPRPFLKVISEGDKLSFHRVTVTGYYQNSNSMLLQNQFHQGQVGFDVLTPIKIPGEKKLLLVDRGWVAKPHDLVLPTIQSVNEEQQIHGYLKTLDERQFILGKNILNDTQIPVVMQKIDINELTKLTHQEFYPYVLRLDSNQAHGYLRDWVITAVEPERHIAYAVQWFLMAIILVIAYLCFSCERVKK